MPAPSLPGIYEFARSPAALDVSDTTVPDATLAPLASSVMAQISADYACVGVEGANLTTAPDVANYEEGAGYLVAERYLGTIAGRAWLVGKLTETIASGGVKSVKVGPEEFAFSEPLAPKDIGALADKTASNFHALGIAAILRVRCVARPYAGQERPALSTFGVSGRRRAIEAAQGGGRRGCY